MRCAKIDSVDAGQWTVWTVLSHFGYRFEAVSLEQLDFCYPELTISGQVVMKNVRI